MKIDISFTSLLLFILCICLDGTPVTCITKDKSMYGNGQLQITQARRICWYDWHNIERKKYKKIPVYYKYIDDGKYRLINRNLEKMEIGFEGGIVAILPKGICLYVCLYVCLSVCLSVRCTRYLTKAWLNLLQILHVHSSYLGPEAYWFWMNYVV